MRIYDYLKREAASEKKEGDTEEQFFYKTRKKGFGSIQKGICWELPKEIRTALGSNWRRSSLSSLRSSMWGTRSRR